MALFCLDIPGRFSLCVLALLTLVPGSVRAEIITTGSASDIQAFNDMLTAYSKKSNEFKKLIEEINRDKKHKVNIILDRTSHYVDNWTDKGTTINLANLDKLPDPNIDVSGGLKMPKDLPPWAETRCEAVAHVLGEAYYTATSNIPSFDNAHDAGIKSQNLIRKDFKQIPKWPECIAAINRYKDPEHHKGFLYVEIEYGHNLNQKISFDESGMAIIKYYKYGNQEYTPPQSYSPGAVKQTTLLLA